VGCGKINILDKIDVALIQRWQATWIYNQETECIHGKQKLNGIPLFYQHSRTTVGIPLNLPVIERINGVEL
jgi:hypothetical protein